MKNYFLDTSFLIDLMKSKKKAIRTHEEIKGREVTGSPCIYELSKFTEFNLEKLFINKRVLKFTVSDAQEAGDIYYELSQKGDLIGEMDLIIAGMVRNRNVELITKDDDFKEIEGIDLRLY